MPATLAREAEPRVVTSDVAGILARIVQPGEDNQGESVALIAERAGCSTRTVYRVLSMSTPTINLDLADRLVVAADAHISECRMVTSRGSPAD